MAGWYELSKNSKGQFHFVLKAGNSETILSSEQYESKASAEKGMESVRTNCSTAARFESKASSNGKHYFVLKAGNHQIIGTSQMYASEDGRDNGIKSVMTNGGSKTVKEM
jgi:uncharacterized protein